MTTVQSAFYFSGQVAIARLCPCPCQMRDRGYVPSNKCLLWWPHFKGPQQELSPAM